MGKGGKGMAIGGIITAVIGIIATIGILYAIGSYCTDNPYAEECRTETLLRLPL